MQDKIYELRIYELKKSAHLFEPIFILKSKFFP